MKVTCPFSCFLFLSFGACFPPGDGDVSRYPTEGCRVTEGRPGFCLPGASPRRKRSPEDQRTLFNIARELQNFEKEKAGIRFRFGRQPGSQEEESEDANYLPEDVDGQKRSSTLGSLAEELNGYGREKGGFSFRFGRRRNARLPSRAD